MVLTELLPQTPRRETFPDAITGVSPSFVEIYNEAAHAEGVGLLSVCGPGYRKALEFLVKDYAIKVKKATKDEVQKMNLSPCIKKYLPGSRSADLCAGRAAWLGNDETHYVRTHPDKDLDDLKTLIKLTVHELDSEMLIAGYATDMPESKK